LLEETYLELYDVEGITKSAACLKLERGSLNEGIASLAPGVLKDTPTGCFDSTAFDKAGVL